MNNLFLVLPAIVFIILLWFVYTLVNSIVTMIKTTKKDKTMVCGLNFQGKVFYAVLAVIYIGVFVGCLYLMISHIIDSKIDDIFIPLNVLTVVTIVVNYLMQFIIFFGQRQVLIGRILFDYRKIKRVTYPKRTKLRFAYGQKTLETNIRFIDDSLLKKSLQKTR